MDKEQSFLKSRRISWIDILKGIAIILVVTGHIYINDTVFKWIYSFHRPIFFFAAGWCFRKKPILMDIKRRFQTVLIPYYSFGFLILIYWQMAERHFRDSSLPFSQSFIGLLTGSYPLLDFNLHIWFLPCFFFTAVLYNVLWNLLGRKTFIVVSALSVLSFFPLPDFPYCINRLPLYIGFYAIGNIACLFRVDNTIRRMKKSVKLMTALVFLAVNMGLSYIGLTHNIMWFITGAIGIAGVLALSVFIDELWGGAKSVLSEVGQSTLCILCVHGPIYRIMTKIVSMVFRISTEAARSNFEYAVLIIMMTLAISWICYKIIMKAAPWMVGKSSITCLQARKP